MIVKVFYRITFLLCAYGFPVSASTLQNLEKLIVDESYSQALEIAFPLAKKGNSEAQLFIAEMYYEGTALKQDYAKAIYWACRASETDDYAANKFRVKISLRMISEDYQPNQCSSSHDILKDQVD